jgi:hypothetical protein
MNFFILFKTIKKSQSGSVMKNYGLVFFMVFLFFGKAGAQNFPNIINYNLNNTPVNGVKIKTNLPFTSGTQMPTITIQGYNYGTSQTIGLQIVYYIYGTTASFTSASISSFGGYTPQVILANESGKVVIYINDKSYFQRFTVSAYAQGMSGDVSANYTGWSVADEALTGTNQLILPYKNVFSGTVTMPGNGVWNSSGSVGIGTLTPLGTLQVAGDEYVSRILTTGNNLVSATDPKSADIVIGSDAGTRHDASMMWWSAASASRISNTADVFYMSVWGTTTPNVALAAAVGGTSYIQGKLAIGTTNPQGYMLAVNGSAIATSMTVKAQASWPDYVFKRDYPLPSLSFLKSYIYQNHHLPDMPTATQVAKDGLNLGDMNKLLTKKVEELTLYLIEKDQQITDQNAKLDKQEAAIKEQDLRMKQIEKQLAEILKKVN